MSYRKQLEQIGVRWNQRVAYSEFSCKPKSLAKAIEAMQLAGEFDQVSDIFLDEWWTDNVQGCATDGSHWFFTANPNHNDQKRLYVFNAGTPLHDDNIVAQFDFQSISIPGGLDHVGQLDLFEGKIYVSHFNSSGTQVLILRWQDGAIEYLGHYPVAQPTSPTDGRSEPAQFQCVCPWDRTFLSCFGGGTVDVLFIHNVDDGTWTGRSVTLQSPINDWVQGIAFSPYGHLFISTSPPEGTWLGEFLGGRIDDGSIDRGGYHYIRVVSPLNGYELGRIPVLAEQKDQELEGCFFAPASFSDGRTAHLHAVLLENRNVARDNIFFKSFHRTALGRTSTP